MTFIWVKVDYAFVELAIDFVPSMAVYFIAKNLEYIDEKVTLLSTVNSIALN